jgi:hypothetical protein|nr:MAG TPA: hypothetical protein [Caudoviricetes sp.]
MSRKREVSELQKLYNKEYKNYLRRVQRQVEQGVLVKVIQKVKVPKKTSIEKLKKQKAKVIKENAPVVNLLTGELIIKSEKERKNVLALNRVFASLVPFEQDYARQNNITTLKGLKELKSTGVLIRDFAPVPDYDLYIDMWYDSLDSFVPFTAHYLRMKTDALLATATDTERALFGYTYKNAPEVFPAEPYMDKATIDAVFSNILKKMKFFENSEDFQQFINMQDNIIERE